MAAAPFNSGILATGVTPGAFYDMRPASAQVLRQVVELEALCKRHDVRLAAAALQYPLRNPVVQAVVAGAKSIAELDAITGLMVDSISEALWEALGIFIQRTMDWELG